MFDAGPTPWSPESKLRLCDGAWLLLNIGDVVRCIEKAVEDGGGEWKVGDVIARLLITGSSTNLWTSERDGKIEACAVTEIQRWPHLTACTFLFVGGNDRSHWLKFEDDIQVWAKAQGATEFRAHISRRGWNKDLIPAGWSESFVILRKPFNA